MIDGDRNLHLVTELRLEIGEVYNVKRFTQVTHLYMSALAHKCTHTDTKSACSSVLSHTHTHRHATIKIKHSNLTKRCIKYIHLRCIELEFSWKRRSFFHLSWSQSALITRHHRSSSLILMSFVFGLGNKAVWSTE